MSTGNPGVKKTREHGKKISETKRKKNIFIREHGKFPPIPDLCHCKKHCGTIVYDGNEFAPGHNSIGIKPWNTGIHLPVEMIETLRKSHLGIIPTQETRKKMRIANSGENNGFFGHKHSEEFKESRRGKKNPRYGKTPSHGKKYPYDSPIQGRIYLNNSWEVCYVQYLDKHNILWMYEMETFELSGEKTYTPDFFLPQFEKFIEIKGWMKQEDQEKIDKFRNEYPWNLDVLRKKELRNLGIRLGKEYIKERCNT